MTSSASTDNTPPQPPPTLPPSSLRASSSTTLHDLLNFPSPNLDTPMPPPPSVPQHPAFQPGMEYYPVYHHPGMVQGHPLQMQGPPPPEYLHHPGAYGQPPPPFPHLASHPYASLPVGNPYEHMASSSKHRRDSIPSSITSMDDGADRGSTSRNTSQAPGEQMEVPPEIIAGLHGRQLTEKKRKWRAKQGVQGPGKSWRKGLKDSDRPPPPPPLPVPEPLVGHVEENRERHYLEPDWKSPLPPKKRKELTEKNRSRFVASAPAVKYNQAWITGSFHPAHHLLLSRPNESVYSCYFPAEPLLNKGVEKTMPVRQWKIGNRMVRSITGKHWVSKSGWVGGESSSVPCPSSNYLTDRGAQLA